MACCRSRLGMKRARKHFGHHMRRRVKHVLIAGLSVCPERCGHVQNPSVLLQPAQVDCTNGPGPSSLPLISKAGTEFILRVLSGARFGPEIDISTAWAASGSIRQIRDG